MDLLTSKPDPEFSDFDSQDSEGNTTIASEEDLLHIDSKLRTWKSATDMGSANISPNSDDGNQGCGAEINVCSENRNQAHSPELLASRGRRNAFSEGSRCGPKISHNHANGPPVSFKDFMSATFQDDHCMPLQTSDFRNSVAVDEGSDSEDKNGGQIENSAPSSLIVARGAPQGSELTTAQVLPQEKILRQISHQARTAQARQ